MPQLPIRASQDYIDALPAMAELADYPNVSAMIEALLDAEANRVGIALPARANNLGVTNGTTIYAVYMGHWVICGFYDLDETHQDLAGHKRYIVDGTTYNVSVWRDIDHPLPEDYKGLRDALIAHLQ